MNALCNDDATMMETNSGHVYACQVHDKLPFSTGLLWHCGIVSSQARGSRADRNRSHVPGDRGITSHPICSIYLSEIHTRAPSFFQHSMVFFFHRYELPAIMAQHQVFIITRNQGAAAAAAAAAAGAGGAEAAGGGAEAGAAAGGQQGDGGAGGGGIGAGQQASMQRARLIVTRLFSQLAAQRHQQEPRPPGPTAAVGVALANLRRLPVVGQLLQGREQFATVRRVFLGHGGNARLMQVRLQRINVADIPGLRNQVAAAMAAAGAAQRGQSAATDEPTIGDVATTDVAAAADATATPAANDAAGELWRHSFALIEWGQHTSLTFTTRA